MKKMIFVLLLVISFSCSKNDDHSKEENFQLTGEWYLVDIACFCAFDDDIDFQEFKLNFEETGSTVHFSNPTDSYFYIAETGTYQYNLDNNVILIEGSEPYTFKIEGSRLILTRIDDPEIADDELVLTYRRK